MNEEGKPEVSLCVGWCDLGSTDSSFTSNIANFVLQAPHLLGVTAVGITHTVGNQIARQRGDMLKEFESLNCDWLLWVDSDIVFSLEAIKLLWENKNIEKAPVVCGVYFISPEPNVPLMAPVPCIFKDDGVGNTAIHPLPENELIDIDVAGLGFCLMHKSVAHKLREVYGNTTFEITIGDTHVSEDVSFFRKLKALQIPVKAHTGAHVQHIKRFVFDINYYNLWWNVVAPMRKAQEKADDNNL